MFTGIVRHVGTVTGVRPGPSGRRLSIDLGPLAEALAVGDSVAVAGACLTAARVAGRTAEFDVMGETLSRTTLGTLAAGSRVNLERSLRLGDGLDGHLVQGHVDGLAEVRAIHRGGQHLIEFAACGSLTDQMVPKGSVAIDGVSLTLVGVGEGTFRVALIPTTLAQTTLGGLRVGEKVNVEADIIGKYVRRQLGTSAAGEGITMEKLEQAGFE